MTNLLLTNLVLVAILLVVVAAFPWLIVVALGAGAVVGVLKTLKWAFT